MKNGYPLKVMVEDGEVLGRPLEMILTMMRFLMILKEEVSDVS